MECAHIYFVDREHGGCTCMGTIAGLLRGVVGLLGSGLAKIENKYHFHSRRELSTLKMYNKLL